MKLIRDVELTYPVSSWAAFCTAHNARLVALNNDAAADMNPDHHPHIVHRAYSVIGGNIVVSVGLYDKYVRAGRTHGGMQ